MATTYTDATMGARAIGARTDSAGTPVTDVSAEEDRYSQMHDGQGKLAADSLVPAAGAAATMNVVLGSGSAKADFYVVAGTIPGQGNYLVRLAGANQTVTLNAADGSLPRKDEIYLVVLDNAYDSTGLALPRFAYRDGTPAASPSAPGPDPSWDAYVKLATIDVPAAAADILACTITDERTESSFAVRDMDVAGDLTVAGTGIIDGVNIGTHAHDGTAAGGTAIDATDLTNIKAAVDAANVDADTLDGLDSTDLAPIAHVGAGGGQHSLVSAGSHGFMSNTDKSKLDGIESGATADQSAAEILASLKTVDGAGSGLDADLLDGNSAAAFALASHGNHVTTDGVDHDDIVLKYGQGKASTAQNIGTGLTPLSTGSIVLPSRGVIVVMWNITISKTNTDGGDNILTILPRDDGVNMDTTNWQYHQLHNLITADGEVCSLSGIAVQVWSGANTSTYSLYLSKQGNGTFDFERGHITAFAIPY